MSILPDNWAESGPEYIYLHWPFCPYKCHFCPFVALAGHDAFMERYHHALLNELTLFARKQNEGKRPPIKTIFLGGGTPSTYPSELLLDMSAKLKEVFTSADMLEFSIEVNPGTVCDQQLAVWKQAGINRLSIGVQSLNETVLQKLNRWQETRDVYRLLDKASYFFDNISIDLIIGLPGISVKEWKETITQLALWPVQHVSIYFLTVHEQTPLYYGVKKGKVSLPADDEVVDLYDWTVSALQKQGFGQYEISNFAKGDKQSRHNAAYWKRKPYRGFGLGACSFDGVHRFQNDKNLLAYLKQLEEGELPIHFSEKLTKEQVWLEWFMLGMRQVEGVALAQAIEDFSEAEKLIFFAKVQEFSDAEYVVCKNGRLQLSPKGLSVANEIIARLSH